MIIIIINIIGIIVIIVFTTTITIDIATKHAKSKLKSGARCCVKLMHFTNHTATAILRTARGWSSQPHQ